jgi:hypothetical protein
MLIGLELELQDISVTEIHKPHPQLYPPPQRENIFCICQQALLPPSDRALIVISLEILLVLTAANKI